MTRARLILVGILLLSVAGLGVAAGAEEIVLKGSTTVLPIAAHAAEEFTKLFPEIEVSVFGGGSGVGIAALIDGTTDIALASRAMKPNEWEKALERGIYPYHFWVAQDGIAIVVHPSNPLERLLIEDIKAIYTGQINNWKELGGPDLEIVVVSRDTASGTYETFKKMVLGGERMRPDVIFVPSNAAMAATVAATPGAVGYIGMGYITESIKVLAVAHEGEEFMVPEVESVRMGIYPLSRPLFMITNGFPTGAIQKFISFILSDQGQSIVEAEGFVSIH